MSALANASWALAAGNVLAIWLIQRNTASRTGWAFSLLWQIPWTVYSLATGQYGFIALSVGYGFVYARGVWERRASVQNSVQMARCSRCLRDWPEDPAHPGWAGLHDCPGVDTPFMRCEAVLDMPTRRTQGHLRVTYRCDLQDGHPGDHHVAFPINATFTALRRRGW